MSFLIKVQKKYSVTQAAKVYYPEITVAGLSSILYHYTTARNAKEILEKNKFLLSKEKDHYALSMFRSKLSGYFLKQKDGVVFVLDGRKMAENYAGQSYDDFDSNGENKEFIAKKFQDEMEDRIISFRPHIDAVKYIKEIHFLPKKGLGRRQANYDAVRDDIIKISKQLSIPIFVYKNEKSWRRLRLPLGSRDT